MTMVCDIFQEVLQLEPGKKVLVPCADDKQLASVRSMLYAEKKHFETRTGQRVSMACSKNVLDDGQLVLEVRNEELAFRVVEDRRHE